MKNLVDLPHQTDLDGGAGAPDRSTAPGTVSEAGAGTVEQLTLLPTPEVALRFRLPAETRARGLRHIAEIRQVLASRQAARDGAAIHRLPPRNGQQAA